MKNGDDFKSATAKVRAFLAEDVGQPDMGPVPVIVPESVVAGIAEAIEETAKAAAQRHKRQN